MQVHRFIEDWLGGNMGEFRPLDESEANSQADGTYRGEQAYLPKSILLLVGAVFVQINLYVFATPLLDITGANSTLPSRQP